MNEYVEKIIELADEFGVGTTSEMEKFFEEYASNDMPAALKHHNNRQWGLWSHLYEMLRLALIKNKEYSLGYNNYSIIKVVLCHDLDKFEKGCQPRVLKNGAISTDKSKGPLEYQPEMYEVGHGENSLYLASKWFALDAMERQAIRFHMSFFDYYVDFEKVKGKLSKFTNFIFLCDYEASMLIELTYDLSEEPMQYAEEILKRGI